MSLKEIKESSTPSKALSDILDTLHREGPSDTQLLEKITYFKEFHPVVFAEYEEKIISALGLFYKITAPNNLYSFLMQGFGEEHQQAYGALLTPVQASIRRAIDEKQYISISAPTSAGKSYSIRDFIAEGSGDAVVVVPSRALIAEYMNSMRRKFEANKGVMISSFVDLVFMNRELRRIFVLTPERSKDLYKFKDKLNIQTFFFDEAQISEESTRGIIFDVAVRRVKKHFPNAKLIFAHPFIENPEAQFSKHQISDQASYARSYLHGSVGRICICKKQNNKYYYFSPYIERGDLVKNCIEFDVDFRTFALSGSHSILVYVSKNSIYNGSFKDGFEDYISTLPDITNTEAKDLVETIRHIVGADKPGHNSSLVNLLKKGVVIHHGSIPLEVRFLIEDFIRKGYSSICFATSTLAQGINMPFDIVWLENNRFEGNENERALAFKNLIGRAGRLTSEKMFDYGYVYTTNAILFSKMIQTPFRLQDESILENPPDGKHESDEKELIESIQNDTFDDEKNIPLSKVERLSEPAVLIAAKRFLDIFYRLDDLRSSIGGSENKGNRDEAKDLLQMIYEASIGRQMYTGESSVFDQAIDIFFHMAQGRSFSEIVGIRYSAITNRDRPNERYASFSQPAKKLPDSSLEHAYSLFARQTPKSSVNYDSIVYDTYDYMDQVISFSLADTMIAAFEIYFQLEKDERAEKIIELFKYGTNNKTHILLLRYGFPPESVKEIASHIVSIDENGIVFSPTISNASIFIQNMVEWYLPVQ